MTMDASVISKTSSDVTSEVSRALQTGETSKFDQIFPIFDQIAQTIKLPKIIYWVALIYLIFQMFCSSFWLDRNPVIPQNSSAYLGYKICTRIAFIDLYDDNDSNCTIVFVITFVLFALTIFLFTFQYVYFKQYRRLLNWTLYPTRLCIEILPLIFMHPTAHMAGITFVMICSSDCPIEFYFYFIFSLAFYIGCFVFLTISDSVIMSTAYISRNPLASFDFAPLFTLIACNSALSAIHYGFHIFDKWTLHPLILFHIMLSVMAIYKLRIMSFIQKETNYLIISTAVAGIVMDLLRLTNEIYHYLPEISTGLIGIAVLFVSSIVVYFISEAQIKVVKKHLAYNGKKNLIDVKEADKETSDGEIVQLTEDVKYDRFQELKFDTNADAVAIHLHYGLEYMCDMFIDFSLIKYLITNYTSREILMLSIRYLTLFPSETRLLNLLLKSLSRHKNLSFKDRFLLYQVYRIKVQRQSSASAAAADKLYEMKLLNKQIESSMRGFFFLNDASCALMMAYSEDLERARALWEETIKEYPNSANHYEAYTAFLVESCTDFETAVRTKHRAQMIEAGRNYSTDHCFRGLARTYPNYLKKKVLDFKGNFLRIALKSKGNKSTNSSHHSTMNTSEEMDAKMEEEIGKVFIIQSKTRLALQGATENRKARTSKMLSIFNMFAFILCVGVLVALYAVLSTYFDNRYDATTRSTTANDCRCNFALATFSMIVNWAENMNPPQYDLTEVLQPIWDHEDNSNSVLDPKLTSEERMIDFNEMSRTAYDEFLNQLAVLAEEGTNIYALCKEIFSNVVPIYYFKNGEKMKERKVNLKTALTYEYISQVLVVPNHDFDKFWSDSQIFCSCVATQSYVSFAFRDLRNALVKDQRDTAAFQAKLLQVLEITITITLVVFVVTVAGCLTITILFIKEVNSVARMLLKLDMSHKQQAAEYIRKGIPPEENDIQQNISTKSSSNGKLVFFNIVFFLLFSLISVFILLIFTESVQLNTYFGYMALWTYSNSVQAPVMVDALISTMICIFLKSTSHPITTEAIDFATADKMLVDWMEALVQVKENNLIDADGVPPLKGFSDLIDALLIRDSCKVNSTDATFHDMYMCASTSQMVSYFRDMISEIRGKIIDYDGQVKDQIPVNAIHLVMNHAIPKIREIDSLLDRMMARFINEFKTKILIYFIVGIVLSCIALIVGILFNRTLDRAYGAAIALFRRVPPLCIVSDHELSDFLLNRTRSESSSAMTTAASIIHNSPDGIICLSSSGIIESVNPSITALLGYTPEQMLGQNFTAALAVHEHEKISSQVTLMKNRQSALSFEDHIMCLSDNDSEVPCNITILAMTDGDNTTVESFVFILRDETTLLQRQKEAEAAKQQSENLLYQILPRGIVNRINQGEKDITFSVASASIMFIDIVKFSDYSASLTPQEIMGSLSMLFGAFDECLAKYNLLTKIKLIGDVYMCAAGLFTPDEPPASHAEQIIKFGLEALQILEETNIKLNANLQVRIGVNTGGPLIAGVLGTDKPVFDIIGDPINIAARLQSTDVAGRIQISQNTYDLVSSMDFSIEPRGEVFLKGKGKTQAYLVKPTHGFAFQLSSTDIMGTTSMMSLKEIMSTANTEQLDKKM